jgi:hypothetical protein
MPLPFVYNHAYQSYKTDTKTILNWLARAIEIVPDEDRFTPVVYPNWPCCNQSHLSLPLKDRIVGIAKQLVYRNVQPTRHLQPAFENAIRNHRKRARYYNDIEMARCDHISIDTKQHFHFIDLLAQAYTFLFPDTAA